MSSILIEYEPIFNHYGIVKSFGHVDNENERDHSLRKDIKNRFKRIRQVLERNENNKKTKNDEKKKINAKTIHKPSKQKSTTKLSPTKSKQTHSPQKKANDHDKVLKIPIPEVAKTRKASHTNDQHQSNKTGENLKSASAVPVIALHTSGSSTETSKTLQSVQSRANQSISSVPSSIISTPLSMSSSRADISGSNPVIPTPLRKQESAVKNKPSTDFESQWDLDEINKFTQEIFKNSTGDHAQTIDRPDRIRPKCAADQNKNLDKYIQSRSHCMDIFEEYITSLKRQHGIIRNAASDPPTFDPGVTVTGPQVKKDVSVIDKEESRTIKKLLGLEPRKKYALVHEQVGIFIIGGYNLYVNIPIQNEPTTDYLFKFDSDVVKIPPLTPCRVNFAIYTDGEAIYVAGGQTIHNELLDDVQRLNIKSMKWEYVTTLTNPIAACGMTLDDQRIYLVGGYDILQNVTTLLPDYTIYNISTRQFEKSADLPSARCRSLVFATNQAIFCISGLTEIYDENNIKKMKISTDILKWTPKMPIWIKVSETPPLTKFHALSFTDPYLEIIKRTLDDKGEEIDTVAEAYYDFQTNVWTNGKAPSTPPKSTLKVESAVKHHTSKSSSKSKTTPSKKASNTKQSITTKTPLKHKSPSVNKSPSKHKIPSKQQTTSKHQSPSKHKNPSKHPTTSSKHQTPSKHKSPSKQQTTSKHQSPSKHKSPSKHPTTSSKQQTTSKHKTPSKQHLSPKGKTSSVKKSPSKHKK